MSDHSRNSGDRRSKPVQAPRAASGEPLGHIPLVLAWVKEQEALREKTASRAASLSPRRVAVEVPADEEFDLPIPGFDQPEPRAAVARHVVPPPAGSRASVQNSQAPGGFANPSTQRHSLPNSQPAPGFASPSTQRHSLPNSQPAPGFASPSTQRHSLPNSQPAPGLASPSTQRNSLPSQATASFPNPSTQRHSLPNSRPPPSERNSLGPSRGSHAPATSRSLPPGRRSAPPIDDPRWVFARALLSGGRKSEALTKLEELYYAQPEHEPCRAALLELYLEMRNKLNINQHADWVILRHLQANRAEDACDCYRRVRTACPDAVWSERTLALLAVAGDRLRDRQVVVDATKLLMQGFPASVFLPRALFATANCQLDSGRADLARTTLQHLVATYPMDAVASLAAQKLRELGPG